MSICPIFVQRLGPGLTTLCTALQHLQSPIWHAPRFNWSKFQSKFQNIGATRLRTDLQAFLSEAHLQEPPVSLSEFYAPLKCARNPAYQLRRKQQSLAIPCEPQKLRYLGHRPDTWSLWDLMRFDEIWCYSYIVYTVLTLRPLYNLSLEVLVSGRLCVHQVVQKSARCSYHQIWLMSQRGCLRWRVEKGWKVVNRTGKEMRNDEERVGSKHGKEIGNLICFRSACTTLSHF